MGQAVDVVGEARLNRMVGAAARTTNLTVVGGTTVGPESSFREEKGEQELNITAVVAVAAITVAEEAVADSPHTVREELARRGLT